MRYVKLQFGCLLMILYIVITYIRAVKRGKTSRQYNLLILVAPIEDSFSIIEKGIGTDFDPHLAQIF